MDITYVLCQGHGGLPHYTAELANAVANYADVSVIKPTETSADEFFGPDIDLHEVLQPVDISVPKIAKNEISVLQTLNALRSYRNIDRVREIDPDIVHFTASSELFPYLKYFIRRTGIDEDYPFIETFHNIDPKKRVLRTEDISDVDANNPYRWLLINNIKNVMNMALPTPNRDHAIVHTEVHRGHLIDRGMRPEQISVIPHGIFEIFRNEAIDVEMEPNTILFFGNIVSRKGPDTLIKAIPRIAEEIPDVKVIFAGDGKFDPESRAIMDAYPENFEIHNEFVSNEAVGEFYARSQLVALPQRKLVGQSGTVTIAYSFGRPVVTSSVGTFPKMVRDSGSGLVVPPNDPDALGDAIMTILKNENLWEVMAANTATVREELSWDNIAKRHYAIYEGLVDAPRSRHEESPLLG